MHPTDTQVGIYLWSIENLRWERLTLENFIASSDIYTTAYAYTAGGLIEYQGFAIAGTSKASVGWKIKKFTYSGTNITDIQFANGNSGFNHVWNNYAGYGYS